MRDTTIAGNKTCGDWVSCRDTLAAGADADAWQAAFDDYFYARVQLRYLKPIELLRSYDSRRGEGFSMAAIHCSLVEFLESAVQGTRYRCCRTDAELGDHEYRKSGPVFVSFLTKRAPFTATFDEALAHEFYTNIRCALLHEACTKGGWLIRASGASIVDRPRRILYRDNFHDALLEFLRWYRTDLGANAELQKAFLRKMNWLCEEHEAA